jgi:hypothetical protein
VLKIFTKEIHSREAGEAWPAQTVSAAYSYRYCSRALLMPIGHLSADKINQPFWYSSHSALDEQKSYRGLDLLVSTTIRTLLMAQLLWASLLVNKSCSVYYAARRSLRTIIVNAIAHRTHAVISNMCLVWRGSLCQSSFDLSFPDNDVRPEIQFFSHS